MAATLTIRRLGDSLGVILPETVLDELKLSEGDTVLLIRTPAGVELTPYEPELAEAVDDARQFMRTHRNAFRELAR